jgi:chitodextrinase
MVSNQNKDQTLVRGKKPFAKLQLLMIAGVVAVSGAYMATRIFAASGSITILPATATVNIGDTVTVSVRENSSTDTVNAVQANISYDPTRFQYVSVDETGSAFGLVALTQNGAGLLQIARGVSGGSAPVTGDQLVTKVTFKALAGGASPLGIATGSALVRSTDNVDILVAKNGATFTLSDLAAPSIPTGLALGTVQPTLTAINLAWTASTDNVAVASYRVYRNGNLVASPTTPAFADSGLTPGTVYSYKVAAVDTTGNASAQSTAFTASTLADTAAPTVPGIVTLSSAQMTSLALSWTASTDNVGVTGYHLFRNGAQIAAPTGTTYTDTNLSVNTAYSYTVASVDAAGNVSAQTAAASIKTLADTVAPNSPTGLNGAVTGQNIALSWTASTDNVGVTGYTVYRDNVQIATVASGTTYNVTGAPTGTHLYAVSATDAAGNESAKSTAVSLAIFIVGDINKDTKVDVFDLSTLLANWAKTGLNTSDLNGDSVVNIFDLSVLLSHWTG